MENEKSLGTVKAFESFFKELMLRYTQHETKRHNFSLNPETRQLELSMWMGGEWQGFILDEGDLAQGEEALLNILDEMLSTRDVKQAH